MAADSEPAAKPRKKIAYPGIVGDLREEILSGAHKYGDRLPAEPALMARFEASRPTVHRALTELEHEGLVELQRGNGTFVRYLRPVLRNIGVRMSADVWGSGKSVWDAETEGREYATDSGRVSRGAAPEDAERFLETDDVWIRERRHLVDGAPVMLSVSYYPADIVDGSQITEADTGPGGSPARLAELGHAPSGNGERIRLRRPTADERKRLQLPRGTQVADIVRVSRDADGRTVEVTEMVANGDVFVFQVDYTP